MKSSHKNWPTNIDYLKAVQRPDLFLPDSDIQQCQPKINQSSKRPLSWSGNFAIVFNLYKSTSSWAVKCFTSPPAKDANNRYAAISSHLKSQRLQWLIDFDYQTKGVLVKGQYYPIVKMEWVEGERIDVYITTNLTNKLNLQNLLQNLFYLQQELCSIQTAHGDLQHGNILVTQSGQIKLVDYDGMYVPALRGKAPNESGHRNYQHHNRSSKDYNEQVDDFSFDVIMLSLAASIIESSLWTQFHFDDENFLFRKADFEKPDQSSVFKRIAQINDPNVQFLCQRLICRCKNLPLPTVPIVNPQSPVQLPSRQLQPQPVVPPVTAKIPPTPGGGGSKTISRPWPIWLTRLLVQVNNQLLILVIVSLLVLGFYWLVQLWNTQDKLTPIQTVEKFYETAPSNPKAASELGSDKFKKLVALDSKFWNSVEKVELFNTQSLGKSETNISLKLFVKYLMKDGTSKCEPIIVEFVFDATTNKWLINNNVKLLDSSCPLNLH